MCRRQQVKVRRDSTITTVGRFSFVVADSWDAPVETFEREETLSQANAAGEFEVSLIHSDFRLLAAASEDTNVHHVNSHDDETISEHLVFTPTSSRSSESSPSTRMPPRVVDGQASASTSVASIVLSAIAPLVLLSVI